MKKLKSQSGRSMVEMLGVLAIIGVLSVGGIAGYSLSMRRHRANGVVDIFSKYAMIVYSSCQQKLLNGDVTDLSECSDLGPEAHQVPLFRQAIGYEPAGVYMIAFGGITTDTATGIDTVVVSAAFDDDKLCQAVASVIGTTCDKNAGTVVVAPIKQN